MCNVKLTIEYDGTNYHGWQEQKNAVTVQQTVKAAIESVTGEICDLTGCSRTDNGVHAFGQVANFHSNSSIPPDRFSYALNRVLPDDIVILKSEEVDSEFHARFMSKGKKYRYLILNSPHRSALYRNRAYHVTHSLDIGEMQKAAKMFLGKHDFRAFMATGGSVKTTERTMKYVSVVRSGNIIEFEIAGDGFLYNMVRIIAGTLVEVGTGKIKADEVEGIILGGNRKRAGKTAPAHGLYLVEIYY